VQPERDPQAQILEFGRPPDDGSAGGPPWRRWRRWGWPVAVVALLVAAIVVRTQQHGRPAASPAASASPVRSPSPSSASPGASPSAVPTAPVVTELGHPLVDTAAGWELFGRTADALIRIDPARGRITRTPVPRIASTGPVSLVVGRDWAVAKPLDFVDGYLVRDGRAAEPLSGVLAQGGLAAPGPDGASLWVPVHETNDRMALVDLNGRPVGPEIRMVPGMSEEPIGDGTGYLVFNGVGGAYAAGPDGVRRITSGSLLAIGPTRWLAYECDDRYNCGTVLIDRRTGTRRGVGSPALDQPFGPAGVISPDGVHAVIMVFTRTAPPALSLIDTTSGVSRPVIVPGGIRDGDDAMVWSPDGRWLLLTGANGRLYAVGTDGAIRDLGLDLPPLVQLAVPAAPLS
jgi:hypothetical protein